MPHPKIQEMVAAAERDIRRLHAAKTSEGAREAWVSFLEHANRALNRLEGYSKQTGQTQKYKNLLTKEIWATDLYRYMRTARNAHEQGVEKLEISERFNSRFVFPNGAISGAPIVYGKTEDGRTVVIPQSAPTEVIYASLGIRRIDLKPGIRMVPVKNSRGETVLPPIVGNLGSKDEPEPVAAAKAYLQWVIAQINKFA